MLLCCPYVQVAVSSEAYFKQAGGAGPARQNMVRLAHTIQHDDVGTDDDDGHHQIKMMTTIVTMMKMRTMMTMKMMMTTFTFSP